MRVMTSGHDTVVSWKKSLFSFRLRPRALMAEVGTNFTNSTVGCNPHDVLVQLVDVTACIDETLHCGRGAFQCRFKQHSRSLVADDNVHVYLLLHQRVRSDKLNKQCQILHVFCRDKAAGH